MQNFWNITEDSSFGYELEDSLFENGPEDSSFLNGLGNRYLQENGDESWNVMID